ncbi:MAG TPA: hypothetical protein VL261_16800 [Nitrospira sp.]|jgi:hypothetical protein|nr:hypothetical protein [Nitrospira sp.]
MNTHVARWLIASAAACLVTGLVAIPVDAQSTGGVDKDPGKRDPLQLPFATEPSMQSLESTQRMKEALRAQDLRVDPDPNRRMFRPKQPEPGYSEIRPYSGTETPSYVRPIRPLP